MNFVSELADKLAERLKLHSSSSAFTVGISGIDASGKGYITRLLQKELEKRNYKVANINIDKWQNPIPIRLLKEDPVENFYRNVFRWDDFFSHLVVPLRTNRQIFLQPNLIRTDADLYYPFTYDFHDIDIVLIEGIFLFKPALLKYYDCKIWIDCSFETGMHRAIERNSEKLSRERLIQDYNTYYYPAQIYHFQRDNPKDVSDIIYCNDELLGTVGQMTFRQVI